MRIESQPAYVLHTRNFRDSSLLVDLITPDHGRVNTVAKGARGSGKVAKQRRSLIQPFNPVLVSFSGKSELKTLIHIEATNNAFAFKGKQLFSAFYVNELISRLLQSSDDHVDVYVLYEWVLHALLSGGDIEITLRRFELKLLEYLGYGIDFSIDVSDSTAIEPGVLYQFTVGHGFSILEQNDNHSVMPVCYKGEHLLAIECGDFNTESKKIAKQLCRLAIKAHIGAKPLKSRELFL